MAKSSGSIWVSLGLTTQNFSKGISRARKDLNGFQKFSAGMKNMFNPFTIGLGAIAGVSAALVNGISIFKDYEKANSKLEAVLGATTSEMKMLTTQSKDLGATTAFTASQVADLQTELAKLGFTADEIENMTASTLDAAAALGSELGEQAALSGATLKSFALDSSEAARVNDVLAKSAATSALDFQKLSVALPIVGATAKSAGVSLERTTALLGTLSNNGLDASSAATSLRNIFLELSKKGISWSEAMKQINGATDKNKVAMDLFGKRAATAGIILAESGESLEALEQGLIDADGAARDMADTMLDNLAGDITKAGSAWEGFILSLEDGEGVISKIGRGIVQMATDALEGITMLNKGMDKIALEQAMVKVDKMKSAAAGMASELVNGYRKAGLAGDALNQKIVSLMKNSMQMAKEAKARGDLDMANQYAAEVHALKALIEKKKEETTTTDDATDSVKEYTKEMRNAKDAVEFDLVPTSQEQKEALEKTVGTLKDSIGEQQMPKLAIPVKTELIVDEGVEGKDGSGKWEELGNDIGGVIGDGLKAGVVGGFATIGEALGAALASGDVAAVGQAFMMQVADIVQGIGEQMISLGVTAVLAKKALEGLFSNPALAIGAGVALVTVASMMRNLLSQGAAPQEFADGGIISGPTLGLMGEYSGARSNPEVVAPLDKLKNLIGDTGAGGMSEVKFRIEGNELVGILNRTSKTMKYSR